MIKVLSTLLVVIFLTLGFKGSFNKGNLYPEVENRVSPLPQEVRLLLSQRFSYLAEGAQVYAFTSEDGKYVLKLFKGRHRKRLTPSRFWRRMTKSKEEKEVSQRKWRAKFAATRRRYKEAFTNLKDETGLYYLHFHRTQTPLPVTLVDRYAFQIDLHTLPFIIQKRAEIAPDYFKRILRSGDATKLDQAIRSLKDLFATRLQKGYSDPRQSLSSNYGFIDDQAIQIDVGKIEPFDGDQGEELTRIHNHVDAWLRSL
ncbi:MAG: hypothetical protein KR126chlam1_00731 [Chlamydiae bacterium]|nr:hypothetical protein [Chlamydiota bacterium]